MNRFDALMRQADAIRATSIAGLIVKARIADYWHDYSVDTADCDLDQSTVRNRIGDLLALGVA